MGKVNLLILMAPEILKGEKNLLKCDLWSIGIIIYYMYFKEYPYNGKNKNTLFNDINSEKELKTIDNKELNDLMKKLLKINPNDRISWEEYFEHKFFKKAPFFNFKCKQHSQNFLNYYCKNCKLNICEYCLKEHNNHNIIAFYNIGLNDEEKEQIENLFQKIDNKINYTQLKNNIKSFIDEMKSIKDNKTIIL